MTCLPQGAPILTAEAMRAAEQAAFAAGVAQEVLMERAGRAVARAARRLAVDMPIVVVAGPGNNGGDAYVAARLLREWGHAVTVGMLDEPKDDAANAVARRWSGERTPIDQITCEGRFLLVDGLFGTGVSRPLELGDRVREIFSKAAVIVAIDLPSGVATNSGALLGLPAPASLTVALGALKPAHLLARHACGHILTDDLGLTVDHRWCTLDRPGTLTPPDSAHKYRRKVTVVAGTMPGAARLAARGAAGSGAGYIVLAGDAAGSAPLDAVVKRPAEPVDVLLDDPGVLVVGPGLGRDAAARRILDTAIASDAELILDGDALSLLGGDATSRLNGRARITLTPHEGEFIRMFGEGGDDKISRTRDAARATGATIVYKGAVTVIATPQGEVRVSCGGSHWLATAGTGDVLTGAIAAQGAQAGVWLHARASWLAGPAFSADTLADTLPHAVAECR